MKSYGYVLHLNLVQPILDPVGGVSLKMYREIDQSFYCKTKRKKQGKKKKKQHGEQKLVLMEFADF